jgi:hypothetical protein
MTTPRKLFISTTVKDLDAAKAFFTKIGFTFNPKFTDANAACMVVSEENFVMLITEKYFANFSKRELCNRATQTEAAFAISCADRAEVDALTAAAHEAGATEAMPPQDHGFMYTKSFYDLDGHHWEFFWMDAAAAG